MYDVVFFDLFFTLISTFDNEDSKKLECTVLGVSREMWGKISELQLYERSIGLINQPKAIVENIIRVFHPDASWEVINEVTNLRIERFRRTVIDVDPRNLVVLKRIKESGRKLCLISNADVIDKMGWQDSPLSTYFDEVIFSCDVGFVKPDIKIYQHAMSRMGVTADQCIFVGDGGSDELRGAKELGITTVLTTQYRGKLWPDTVSKIQVYGDYVIGHLEELLEII